VIDEAEVIYWGLCPACAGARTPGAQTPGAQTPRAQTPRAQTPRAHTPPAQERPGSAKAKKGSPPTAAALQSSRNRNQPERTTSV